MKKILYLIAIMLFITLLVLPMAALAEGEADGTSLYSWNHLVTVGGATAATLLIVQYIKAPLDKLWKVPTRVVVYIIALAILLTATAFTTGITMEGLALTLLNAVIVSTSAYGSYEVTFKKLE